MGGPAWQEREREETLDEKSAYIGDPTKNVGVEAHVVFGYVEPALYENFPLQSAAVVLNKEKLSGTEARVWMWRLTFDQIIPFCHIWEEFMKIGIPLRAGDRKAGDRNVILIHTKAVSRVVGIILVVIVVVRYAGGG